MNCPISCWMTQQSRISTDDCAENTKRGKRTAVSHLARTIVQKLVYWLYWSQQHQHVICERRDKTRQITKKERRCQSDDLQPRQKQGTHTNQQEASQCDGKIGVCFCTVSSSQQLLAFFNQQPPCCSQTHKPALKASGTEPSLARGVHKPPWC